MLEIVDCPDRRLIRSAVDLVARELADGETEVSVLLPDRKYRGLWHRVLHDRTADAIQEAVSELPHANVTSVPFHFRTGHKLDAVADRGTLRAAAGAPSSDDERLPAAARQPTRVTPVLDARWRQRVTIRGRVRSVRLEEQPGSPSLELVVIDDGGAMSLLFLGRRWLAGVDVGSRIEATGTVSVHKGRLTILNPIYRLLPD
jgi:hypothetical protein